MSKKTIIISIIIILVLAVFIFLVSIRGEFTSYLEEKYPGQAFHVGFVKIDPIYGSYYAKATYLDDHTSFTISRGFTSKIIGESYLQNKNINQYNAKINDMFYGSDIESSIRSVTGSGKLSFDNNATYNQINVYLTENIAHMMVIKKMMNTFKENDIVAEKIIFAYEKNKHLYRIELSSSDYELKENEIEAKIERHK